MKKAGIIAALQNLKPALQAEGVEHIAFFGSRARGDERHDSDIDILVDVAPFSDFSILNLIGVEHLVADATGLEANAFMRRNLGQTFQSAMETDAIEIF